MTQRETYILLVEDTEEHAMLIRRALENGEFRPRFYEIKDGSSALDFLYHRGEYAERRKPSPRPDIILLDLKLPKVHGLEILKRIKSDEKLRDIPVVVITSSEEEKDILSSYQGGADSYFTKSVLFLNKGADAGTILDTVFTMVGV